jgi:hypothetical protein
MDGPKSLDALANGSVPHVGFSVEKLRNGSNGGYVIPRPRRVFDLRWIEGIEPPLMRSIVDVHRRHQTVERRLKDEPAVRSRSIL